MATDTEWYYCLRHDRVEPRLGCRDAERLGPYATREAAENALDRVEERNLRWEADPRWNDEEE